MKNREGQKYRVVNNEDLMGFCVNLGDICTMCYDTGGSAPQFYNKKWSDDGKLHVNLNKLKLIEERPERYASREVNGMDVLDLINHWNLNFSEGNILKYLLREKGEDINDFKKIADYANREVKRLEDCN